LDAGNDCSARSGCDDGGDDDGRGSWRVIGDLDGDTNALAGRLHGLDSGLLVCLRAGLLGARLDLAEEFGSLLAVTSKVAEIRAAVAAEGSKEACQLSKISLVMREVSVQWWLTAHFGMLLSWAEAAVVRAKTVAIAETFMVTDFRSSERWMV
jgi:uncharacterized membrane protein